MRSPLAFFSIPPACIRWTVGSLVVFALCAGSLSAQTARKPDGRRMVGDVADAVRDIRRSFRTTSADGRKKRDAALDALIAAHGPHGTKARKDVSAAYALRYHAKREEDRPAIRAILLDDPRAPAAARFAMRLAQAHASSPDFLAWVLDLATVETASPNARAVIRLLCATTGRRRGYHAAVHQAAEAMASDASLPEPVREEADTVSLRSMRPPRMPPRPLRPMPWAAWDRLVGVTHGSPDAAAAITRLRAAATLIGTDVAAAIDAATGAIEPTGKRVDAATRVMFALARAERHDDDSRWRWIVREAERAGKRSLWIVDGLYDLALRNERVRELLERVAARARDWRVLSMALRALQFQETTKSSQPLVHYRKSRMWQVRLALTEALGAYYDAASVDAAITMLGDRSMRVRTAAYRTLRQLTGMDWGPTQTRWKRWRAKAGKDLVLKPRTATVRAATQGKGYARYFDLEIPSNRFVYVLDNSESMYYGKWDCAVRQAEKALRACDATTAFGLVSFSDRARVWKKKLLPANRGSIKKMRNFLRRSEPYGPTNIIDALRTAAKVRGCDTIILLTDGMPTRGTPKDPAAIIDAVTREMRYARIVVHTVQLTVGRVFPHDAPRDAWKRPLTAREKALQKGQRETAPQQPLGDFLQRLAAATGGRYSVAFADVWRPPPGSGPGRPSTDR